MLELKSVNHRYLDVSFRLPESCRSLEPSLRQLLRGQLHRGKIECQLKVSEMTDNIQPLLINDALVKSLLDASATLVTRYQIANDLTVSQLLLWPGVVGGTHSNNEILNLHIERSFQEALRQLVFAREAEGAALNEHVKNRLYLLQNEVNEVTKHVSLISNQTKEKLIAKLKQFQIEVGESRVEQEIALILARLDVNEELERLQTHIKEVARTLECEDVAGRRLDFLMQELNREANTLSSKSDSALLTQHAVQMKVLIEQMREQIQNIE